jgi:hypothetical protein
MNTCDGRRGAILIELWRSINSSEPSLKETLTAHTKRICNNTDETLRSIESLAIFPDDLDNALDFVCIFVTAGVHPLQRRPQVHRLVRRDAGKVCGVQSKRHRC